MQKILALLTIVLMTFSLSSVVFAMDQTEKYLEEFETVEENKFESLDFYKSIMIESVTSQNLEKGREANELRKQLQKLINPSEKKVVEFDDLDLLSKIMNIEAGNCSEEYYWGVGEVVLNRVESPEFPDTIQKVLDQEGPRQYYGKNSHKLKNVVPQEHIVKAAWQLLEGERRLLPTVVFQDNKIHGSGAYVSLHHEVYGWFYLSLTAYPELYE